MTNSKEHTYNLDEEKTSRNPIRPLVVLVGRPNVGKSTLFNRLTRSRDALVDPTPGLTRDVRIKNAVVNGHQILIADTGGIEEQDLEEGLSGLVSKASLKAAKSADLIIILFDIRQGLTAQDIEIVETIRPLGKPLMFVANKADTSKDKALIGELYEIGAEEIIPISAEHGRGIDELEDKIINSLKTAPCLSSSDSEILVQPEPEDIIRVAIVGRPNVGKSSLFNALTGEERVVVSDVPGTTRDVVDTIIERPGKLPILLADTAGIRRKSKTKQRIEKFSVLKALEAIKRSHICIVVMDASLGVTDQDKKLIGYTEEFSKACITLYNKWDLVTTPDMVRLRTDELKLSKRFIPYSPHINCSAKTGRKIKSIWPLIDRVYEDYSKKISTGRLNRALQEALNRRTPPISKGHQIKMYYTTQTGTCPPTFLIFANYPDKIPNQYKRFLINHFRNVLEMPNTPIKLIFRERDRRK
ncbi:GTP-binding protein EngA [Dissulfuribacter thermophilus]|uniref:GTPase Der n=1 Tax=Dissulfuribacter thermophilus TaxID=1156395 RepID=A0A1B9F5T9_9BACT|nr:ribosome biogenesis GTPase Der [Dissulfuribacter thermophilus]OCC15282.1 GTP-binding protein EngA [Dissulfuribacter thermophilus]